MEPAVPGTRRRWHADLAQWGFAVDALLSPSVGTSSYTEVVVLDEGHLLYIYDRIPNGWKAIAADSPETNSVWVVRVTLQRG